MSLIGSLLPEALIHQALISARLRGRPSGKTRGVKSALDVHHLLLTHGVDHELVRTTTRATSADDLHRALGVPIGSCVAVRCFAVQDCRTSDGSAVHLVAVLVQAGDVPDRESLQRTLHAATVRPATPDEINLHTGFSAAFVSPIGLPENVVVLADDAVTTQALVYVATGEGGVALGIGTRDLLVATRARVAPLTSRPMEADESAPWGAAPGTLAQRAADSPAAGGSSARVIDLDGHRSPPRRIVG